MRNNQRKALSFVLALVMVLGMIPVTGIIGAVQAAGNSNLPTSMDGLSIAYPYNTETIQQTGTVNSRLDALTFVSARQEVESAQLILTPEFDVTDFALTMGSLKNEKGNIIPAWAFEVYVQHCVTVSGSKNGENYNSSLDMYHPATGVKGTLDGIYPDALIPQETAITAGENKISAGKNGGLWINLNVAGAAPGTYTGSATLTVNGTDMQIPVSVRIFDVELPEEVHTKSSAGIWWDQLLGGEGTIDRELADTYYEYLVSKRLMPLDAWSLTKWDDAFAEYAASYLAVSPEISAYSLYHEKNEDGTVNVDVLRTTLTTLIEKNLELAKSGSDADLFKKAYFYIYDEPRNDEEYALSNTITAQLDAVKAELAPMLAAYPDLQASFLNIKQLVTAPNPTDKTYADKKVGSFWNQTTFVNDNYGNTPLTGDSYIYTPQYQWFHTEEQRALYANEAEVWWYGCMHPINPYPTYHINSPLVAGRVESWMRYDYDIDGILYGAVNYWGTYDENGQIVQDDYWNSFVDCQAPGDQMLIYPGAAYGVYGPIGSIRLENIREANEDYEYLWMLENEYGISNISTYTANLYSGVLPSTDASIHYNNRIALLTKLENLSIAQNGATQIAPGQEGFVRGQAFASGADFTYDIGATEEVTGLSFEYKITDGKKFSVALLPDWTNYYGYFTFGANGADGEYAGVTAEKLDDGYIRVIFDMAALTTVTGNPATTAIQHLYIRGNFSDAAGYIDSVQILAELPEINEPTEAPTEAPTEPEAPVEGVYEINSDCQMDVEDGTYDYISFEYQITNSGVLFIGALSPDWGKYYGYYEFNANGKVWEDKGVYCTDLGDGYYRVTLKVSKLERTNNTPNTVNAPETIGLLYIGGNNSATGTIRNIQVSNDCIHNYESVVTPPTTSEQGYTTHTCTICGDSYVDSFVDPIQIGYAIAGDTQIDVEDGSYDYISFEYQITNSGVLFIGALSPDWGKYYGYYEFNTNGKVWEDKGVYCTDLGDGYYRVTLNVSELDRTNNTPNTTNAPEIVGLLYISGSNSATGTIRNIQLSNACSHSYESVVTAPTFTENGITTHTCVNCGDSYETDPVEAYSVSVNTWNIALADDIRANFFLDLDSRIADATVQVTINGQTTSYALSELTQYLDSYVVSSNVAAAQMTDVISITVICGEAVSHSMDYSIRQYADTILNGEYSESTKALVKTMLNYGAAAQSYFAYNTENLANNGYEITDTVEIPTVDSTGMISGKIEGISFYGASLVFESRVAIRYYFTVEGDIANYTFSAGAEPVYKDGMYYVEVPGINPQDYDQENVLTVTDGASEMTVTYSPLTYISRMYNKSDKEGLRTLVAMLYRYYAAAETYLADASAVIRGEAFEASTTIALNNTDALESLSFDYKITNEGTFDLALLCDWNNHYSYYTFTAEGAAEQYAGISCETMEDGYIRVTFQIEELTYIVENPTTVIAMLFFHGGSTAEGYIDNITLNVYTPPVEFEGGQFAAGSDLTIALDNEQEVSKLSFDYQITSGECFGISFLPDWNNFYGYFDFNAEGSVGIYDGVGYEVLDNGYIRVFVDMNAVTQFTGIPTSKVINTIYIRGSYTTASGTITNICINEAAKPLSHGERFYANTDSNLMFSGNNAGAETVSFEYKITNDGTFNLAALNSDWSKYYGYYAFNDQGADADYAGITCEKLSDGYIRVTLTLSELMRTNNNDNRDSVPETLSLLYIAGRFSNANGYIDNIQIN